jgi:hypothetical protein
MSEPPSDAPRDSGRNVDGTFAKGHARLGGRAKGVRCKATVAAEKLLSKTGDVEAITEVILREAKAGQAWACKAWMSVIVPVPRGRPVSFVMPKIEGPQDLPGALLAVCEQVSQGVITPTEAAEIASLLDALRTSYETSKIAQDVERLKLLTQGLDSGFVRWPQAA